MAGQVTTTTLDIFCTLAREAGFFWRAGRPCVGEFSLAISANQGMMSGYRIRCLMAAATVRSNGGQSGINAGCTRNRRDAHIMTVGHPSENPPRLRAKNSVLRAKNRRSRAREAAENWAAPWGR